MALNVQYTRTEADRLGYAKGGKSWRTQSMGDRRTRPVFLCVGSTERKSDRRKNTLSYLQRV